MNRQALELAAAFLGRIGTRHHRHRKPQLGRLTQTLLPARRGAHLTGQAHFTKGDKALGQGPPAQ